MLVFVGLVVSILVAGFLQSTYIHLFFLFIANKLHNLMLLRVVQTPLSFFDSNPLGRIVNRFSSDVASADTSLPI